MANLRQWLEKAVAQYGEPIEAIVVGQHDNNLCSSEPEADENILLPVEAALKKLDYEYDAGYGGAECHPFYAWTASRVFFVGEYDGATGIAWVPRHPVNIEPGFSGQ